eukprot:comp23062_c0_seq2/m.36942 comp23062_c0_seq2/g.36942  ORF comp23062_c0_seq2/g.36942 comp23062_c0_seq2/m.36942 type:complete len:139 (-) comp23062_c0_seq2:556-972(-)
MSWTMSSDHDRVNEDKRMVKDTRFKLYPEDLLLPELQAEKFLVGGLNSDGTRVLVFLAARHNPAQSPAPTTVAGLLSVLDCVSNSWDEVQTHGVVLLIDLTGSGLSNFDFDTIEYLLLSLQDAVPVRVKKILVVNPTW